MIDTSTLLVGWKAIGEHTSRNPQTLKHLAWASRLPVKPQRIGREVCMTVEQAELLKKARR